MRDMMGGLLATALVLVLSAGCGRAVAPAAVGFDLNTARFVDLTHAFDANTIYWPTSPTSFELDTLAYGPAPGGWFYSSFALATPEHGGTHLDAPIHFAAGGQTVEEIALERLIAPVVVIDASVQAAAYPDYLLTVEDVAAFEAEHGRIAVGTIVLMRTDWSRRWPDRRSYLGDDTPGDATNLHFPGVSAEAMRLLANERRIGAIGVDVASIDHGPSEDFAAHRIAYEANIPGFENLTNLDRLPATGAWLIALPMKVVGGSGGPLRAVGVVPSTSS